VLLTVEAAGGASAFFMVERTRFGAPGLEGGGTGVPGGVRINGVEVDARVPQYLEAGDTIAVTTPGGGGYGEAALRDPALTGRDRAMGYLVP
jgi:N-methylhydantoinase B